MESVHIAVEQAGSRWLYEHQAEHTLRQRCDCQISTKRSVVHT